VGAGAEMRTSAEPLHDERRAPGARCGVADTPEKGGPARHSGSRGYQALPFRDDAFSAVFADVPWVERWRWQLGKAIQEPLKRETAPTQDHEEPSAVSTVASLMLYPSFVISSGRRRPSAQRPRT
jgi:hypothetical protein